MAQASFYFRERMFCTPQTDDLYDLYDLFPLQFMV